MRLQAGNRVSKSVRIPTKLRRQIKRAIVRLSLNPVVYDRSKRIVRWERNGNGKILPQQVILRAIDEYPGLSLSAAVEAVLVDLMEQNPLPANCPFLSEAELEQLRRFSALPLLQKIRITQKRHRTAQYLKALPWRNRGGTGKGF